jgi:hypothetical protein
MFKNATFLPFYFADNQLFINSETLVIKSYKLIISEIIILSDFNKGNNLFK